MKTSSFLVTLALTALFSTNSQANFTQYTEMDNDSSGDSFSITFQWDSVGKTITQVISGNFTDASGIYQDINELEASIPTTNGTIEALIADNNFNDVVLYLNAAAVPSPSMVDISYYAVTTSSGLANIGTFYSNPPTIAAVAPEPAAWVMLLLGLSLINRAERNKTAMV